MGKDSPTKELLALFRNRKRDREQSTTRRRRATEKPPQRLADALNEYFRADPQTIRRIEETRALLAWPNYVGGAAARVSQALKIRGRTLIVGVRDALWMQQLSLLKQELIRHYTRDYPKLGINDIFFTRG